MNPYIQKLAQYLESLPAKSPDREAGSMLELLCYIYTVENPVSSAAIRYQFQELDTVLGKLSLEDNNALFWQVCELCEEHAKLGFLSGLRVGSALTRELTEL